MQPVYITQLNLHQLICLADALYQLRPHCKQLQRYDVHCILLVKRTEQLIESIQVTRLQNQEKECLVT